MTPGPDSPADDETSALPDDAELNRLAFGRTTSAAEEAKAVAARRVLDERARAVAEEARAVTELPAPAEEPEPMEEAIEDASPRRTFPWRIVLAIAMVAIFALGIGITVGHNTRAVGPASSATHTPTSTPTPSTIELTAPDIGADLFARKQQPGDTNALFGYPNPEFRASSVRLAFTWTDVGSVFVAQSASPDGGVCLLVERQVIGGGAEGTVGCATAKQFAAKGITVKLNDFVHFKAKWTTAGITMSAVPLS